MPGRLVRWALEFVFRRLLQCIEVTYCRLHQGRRLRRGERVRSESEADNVPGLQARGDERLQTEMALVGMDGG